MPKSTTQRRARLILSVVTLVCLPIGALLFVWLVTLPNVSALKTTNPSTTTLIKMRQAQAHERGETIVDQSQWVPLAQMSPHLRRAVVAAEDASFFSHEGFDWEGIKEAAIANFETGELKRGGSTITQQLAKNLYLSSERSMFRKAREALITRLLEHHLSKERILELYLNVAEWGVGVYGAEAAAHHHFHKSSHDLTREEAAWLAAILPSPRRYDPIRKTTALSRRYERIFYRMTRTTKHPSSTHDSH